MRSRDHCIALLLAIFFAGQTSAQITAPADPPAFPLAERGDRPHWRKNLFKRVLSDQKFLLTTWAPIESRRLGFSLPVLAASAGAADSSGSYSGLDLRLSHSIETWGNENALGAARTLTRLGDAGSGVLLIGGSYLISRWTGNIRLARASSLSAEALANSAIWSTTLKSVTRRARPDSGAVGGEFLVNDAGVSNNSFPSGHAMGAFAVAAVFAGEYRDKRWVPWVAYGSAGLIATSRVALGRHYVTDVVIGGILGRSLGRMVLARENGLEGDRMQDRFEPIFEPEGQRYGVNYRYSW